jgi:hypothetical protein
MSRIYKMIALFCVAGSCHAQGMMNGPTDSQFPGAPLPDGQAVGAEFRTKIVDPKAVEIPLYAGALVSEVLTPLTDKGFHIRWKPEQVTSEMKLLEKPKSTRVDNLLNEILKPWGLHADPDLMKGGGYLVKDLKKKKPKEFAVEQASPP